MTRPETHQNLIHPDKEQNRQRTKSPATNEVGDRTPANVDGTVLRKEQRRHDPVTFPRNSPAVIDRRSAERTLSDN